jgi:hypothetical protein
MMMTVPKKPFSPRPPPGLRQSLASIYPQYWSKKSFAGQQRAGWGGKVCPIQLFRFHPVAKSFTNSLRIFKKVDM